MDALPPCKRGRGDMSENTEMTPSPLRSALAEGSAVVGMGFGAWLIYHSFQPASDVPGMPLVVLGALDILLCFLLLGYLLRQRLRAGEPLPRRWIAGGVALAAGFLGWIGALFLDSQRLYAEEQFQRECSQQLAKLEASLRYLGDVTATAGVIDRHAWDVNHDQYAHLHDQLQTSLRARPAWEKDLTRIDEQVRLMRKAYVALPIENIADQRQRLRGDFQLARDRAVQQAEALRTEVDQAERETVALRRVRWHGVGAAALTGILFALASMLVWVAFDRELAHARKARARLADSEARFRTLIENQPDVLAVVDSATVIVYANPAWKTTFGHDVESLLGAPLLELIHVEDRARVVAAMQGGSDSPPCRCRLSADYGVWHEVELESRPLDAEAVSVIRIREAPAAPAPVPEPAPEAVIEPHLDAALTQDLADARARIDDLERRLEIQRDKDQVARTELEHQRWLLAAHRDAAGEGLLILAAGEQVLSWNPAFAQIWKLSDDTLSAHTWLTVAAHMETLARGGWEDFRLAAARKETVPSDNIWEMTLEDGKVLEVHAQVLRDHPARVPAVRFLFRDVTRERELEGELRHHTEHKRAYEHSLREQEKRLKRLEEELRETAERTHQLRESA